MQTIHEKKKLVEIELEIAKKKCANLFAKVFNNFEIVPDNTIPDNEIHIYDKETGKLVSKITNVKVKDV